jgi:hypothetical protein
VIGWWFPAVLGGLIFVGGFVGARFPTQTLAYLDSRNIPVKGFSRSAAGIRAMGVTFSVIGVAMVIIGFFTLFRAFNRSL